MILKNKVIVFLGNTRYDSPIQATSLFIARNLSKYNKVFFIDYPFTMKDYFDYKRTDKLKDREGKFSLSSDGLMDTDLPNLKIVITPPVLPINFLPEGRIFRFLLKINEQLIASRLKHIFKKQGIKDFIYINSFNFHYPEVVKGLNPSLKIYHCVDPIIVPYDKKHGLISETQLLKDSDLVICTSKALYNEKKLANSNTYFVPNATDSTVGQLSLAAGLPDHERVAGLKKPIIGYLGTIERRINYDLLEKVILAHPDKSFVLAGPVSEGFLPDSFKSYPNVHVIGSVPYDEVPQMIKSFDVAIIPFKKDEVSNTIFPIKLFEYMSAGKPVVASDFNEDLKDFTRNSVEYCGDASSFSRAINSALLNDSEVKIEERKALAKENTWEQRSEQISEIIGLHLNPVIQSSVIGEKANLNFLVNN
ncbi:glycosyltransferase [Pedobacter sp. AW31-3R]|uniref:glycosyltransferase n=1 Tax=Pedobacter sp. AW31-3R TaxID=3445781 RepID=UPI003FA10389